MPDMRLIVVGAVVWGFLRWLKNPEARLRVDRFLLKLPVAGRLIRGLNTGRFSRTFSILTASAVPVLEAEHGRPVLLNILSTTWAALHAAGDGMAHRPDPRWGRLMASLGEPAKSRAVHQ